MSYAHGQVFYSSYIFVQKPSSSIQVSILCSYYIHANLKQEGIDDENSKVTSTTCSTYYQTKYKTSNWLNVHYNTLQRSQKTNTNAICIMPKFTKKLCLSLHFAGQFITVARSLLGWEIDWACHIILKIYLSPCLVWIWYMHLLWRKQCHSSKFYFQRCT